MLETKEDILSLGRKHSLPLSAYKSICVAPEISIIWRRNSGEQSQTSVSSNQLFGVIPDEKMAAATTGRQTAVPATTCRKSPQWVLFDSRALSMPPKLSTIAPLNRETHRHERARFAHRLKSHSSSRQSPSGSDTRRRKEPLSRSGHRRHDAILRAPAISHHGNPRAQGTLASWAQRASRDRRG